MFSRLLSEDADLFAWLESHESQRWQESRTAAYEARLATLHPDSLATECGHRDAALSDCGSASHVDATLLAEGDSFGDGGLEAMEEPSDDLAQLLAARRRKEAEVAAMKENVHGQMTAAMDTGVRVNTALVQMYAVAAPSRDGGESSDGLGRDVEDGDGDDGYDAGKGRSGSEGDVEQEAFAGMNDTEGSEPLANSYADEGGNEDGSGEDVMMRDGEGTQRRGLAGGISTNAPLDATPGVSSDAMVAALQASALSAAQLHVPLSSSTPSSAQMLAPPDGHRVAHVPNPAHGLLTRRSTLRQLVEWCTDWLVQADQAGRSTSFSDLLRDAVPTNIDPNEAPSAQRLLLSILSMATAHNDTRGQEAVGGQPADRAGLSQLPRGHRVVLRQSDAGYSDLLLQIVATH